MYIYVFLADATCIGVITTESGSMLNALLKGN